MILLLDINFPQIRCAVIEISAVKYSPMLLWVVLAIESALSLWFLCTFSVAMLYF
jgi:hypothetical protein